MEVKELLDAVKVEDVMIMPAPCIDIDENLSEVERLFLIQRTGGHVCVTDHNKLVGMISQKYLYKTRSPRKIMYDTPMDFDVNTILDGDSFYEKEILDQFLIKDIMDVNFTTIHPGDTIEKAIKIMDRMKIDCIAVVENQYMLRGMLTRDHIISVLAKELA